MTKLIAMISSMIFQRFMQQFTLNSLLPRCRLLPGRYCFAESYFLIGQAFNLRILFYHESCDVACNLSFLKDLGRLNRFPAKSLSVFGGFCVICIDYMLYSTQNKTFDKMQHHSRNLLVLHICSIRLYPRGRGSDFLTKCQKTYLFAIDYHKNTAICLFQPKFLGRNDLCVNNRYSIFIRSITINNTVYHLCKYPYI